MSEVEFTEEKQTQDYQRRFSKPMIPSSGTMTKLVQKWGLAKDEKSANRLFVIIICLCLVVIYIVFFKGSSNSFSHRSNIPPKNILETEPNFSQP